MKRKIYLRIHAVILYVLTFVPAIQAQETSHAPTRFSPKEFSIPVSPVFDLMGVTPSQVNRTSDIKDFKVDWSFKSWRLNPNLAIQSQPFWELLYNRKDLRKYQSAGGFMRKLASFDLSIGTVQNEANDRRIGFATKINVIKTKDPLMAKDLYDDIGVRYREEKEKLELQLKEMKSRLDTTNNILEKPAIRSEITAIEEQLLGLNSQRNNEINERAKIYILENWNSASLDIAFGKVYTYQSDSIGSLKKLRIDRNTGWGIWVNGAFPLGKRVMISGLVRSTWYEEELHFVLRDQTTLEESDALAIAGNRLYSGGMNIRYGGNVYSFFAEFLVEKKVIDVAADALDKVFTAPGGAEVVESSVKWTSVHPNAFSIGGDWRISRNVIINYGMRWVLDKNWKTQAFIPVAGISCMMR